MKDKVGIYLLLAIVAGSNPFAFAQETTSTALHSDASKGNVVMVNLFKPVYPPLARQANITGEVTVVVTVHQDGTIKAAIESGPAILIPTALASAKQSRFECRMCTAPLSYSLVYTFRLTAKGDCCIAHSVAPQVEQEPQSSDDEGRPQTHIIIAAEQTCLCDPTSEIGPRKTRSPKCFYLWKCSAR